MEEEISKVEAITDFEIILIADNNKNQILLKKYEKIIEIERETYEPYIQINVILPPDERDEIFETLISEPNFYHSKHNHLKEKFTESVDSMNIKVNYLYTIKEFGRLKETAEMQFPFTADDKPGLNFDDAYNMALINGKQLAESYNVKFLDATVNIKKIKEKIKKYNKELRKQRNFFDAELEEYKKTVEELRSNITEAKAELKKFNLASTTNEEKVVEVYEMKKENEKLKKENEILKEEILKPRNLYEINDLIEKLKEMKILF